MRSETETKLIAECRRERQPRTSSTDGQSTTIILDRIRRFGDITPAEAAGLERPFRNWHEVAKRVAPIKKSVRPAWQIQDDKPAAVKEFQTMPIEVAREATRVLQPKSFKSTFKTWRSF